MGPALAIAGANTAARMYANSFVAICPPCCGDTANIGAGAYHVGLAHATKDLDVAADERQISTCTPSSTTRSGGNRKNVVARTALRAMSTNSCSRHIPIPGVFVTISVSRPRK